jgi:hypothetical protein
MSDVMLSSFTRNSWQLASKGPLSLLYPGRSSVVEQLTYNPKSEGSKPVTETGRNEMGEKIDKPELTGWSSTLKVGVFVYTLQFSS